MIRFYLMRTHYFAVSCICNPQKQFNGYLANLLNEAYTKRLSPDLTEFNSWSIKIRKIHSHIDQQ